MVLSVVWRNPSRSYHLIIVDKWAQVPAFDDSCPGQEKKRGGGGSKGGPNALVGTREYEQSDRNR